jgi:hypothetical protein
MKKLGLFASLVAGALLAYACGHSEPAQQPGPQYTPTATTPPGQSEMQPVSGSGLPAPGSPTPASPTPTSPSGGSTGTYGGSTSPDNLNPVESAAGKGDAGVKGGGADGGMAPHK